MPETQSFAASTPRTWTWTWWAEDLVTPQKLRPASYWLRRRGGEWAGTSQVPGEPPSREFILRPEWHSGEGRRFRPPAGRRHRWPTSGACASSSGPTAAGGSSTFASKRRRRRNPAPTGPVWHDTAGAGTPGLSCAVRVVTLRYLPEVTAW